jgi:hypothetical protein
MIKMIINWFKSLFKEEEFDVEKFSEEADKRLKDKLKIIEKSKEYKEAKENIYKTYEEFKEENKDMIGKVYLDEERGSFFKVIKVKEPWFLKSPILVDEANFKWKFDESFEITYFDSCFLDTLELDYIKESCTEYSKEDYEKKFKGNLKYFEVKDDIIL